MRSLTTYQMVFTTLPLAFGILHFILFIFFKRAKENLYFSLFLFFYGASIFFDYQHIMFGEMEQTMNYVRIHRAMIPIYSIFALRFVYSLFYAIGPMLLASGVIAGVLVERQRKNNGGPRIVPSKDVALLIFLVVSLFLPYVAVLTPNWWLLLWVLVIWFVWHLFTPFIANGIVLGFRPKTRNKTKKEYEIKSTGKPVFEDLSFTNVLSKAYVPTAFGLGATFTIYRFLKLTPIYVEFSPGPFGTVADTTSYAIWAIAIGALVVGPVVWLLKDDKITLVHREKPKTKTTTVHSFLIGMTKLYGFILGPFLFVFLETERDYLLTFTLLPLMLYTIFMVSLAATLLYLILSHRRNMHRFLESLPKSAID